jgi:hypothetical protein
MSLLRSLLDMELHVILKHAFGEGLHGQIAQYGHP